MPHGNAYSRVDWTRQVRRSRSATNAGANSIASTGDSLASPQFAISRPCKTAESWRSLPLNAELLGCHGGSLFSTVANRWDEKAGLRRDAVGSQVIDVL